MTHNERERLVKVVDGCSSQNVVLVQFVPACTRMLGATIYKCSRRYVDLYDCPSCLVAKSQLA